MQIPHCNVCTIQFTKDRTLNFTLGEECGWETRKGDNWAEFWNLQVGTGAFQKERVTWANVPIPVLLGKGQIMESLLPQTKIFNFIYGKQITDKVYSWGKSWSILLSRKNYALILLIKIWRMIRDWDNH